METQVFVVELAGLQAVVELAEELVEQVPLGLVVPVSGGAAGVEVAAGTGRRPQRREGPDRADRGETPILDMAVQHYGFLAAGAGDRCGSGEGFESAGISEAGAVIADLGEYPGAGQHPQAGEAGDDLGVRVLVKMGDRRLGEISSGGAGGLELTQQCGELDAIAFSTTGGWCRWVSVKTSRRRCTSRSRLRWRPALTSSRRSRAGVSFAASVGVGAAAKMVRASARASPPSGSPANAAMAAG